ncbi:MAG TPA: hypothetical protein VKU01_28425 [Bryobacteraceae bacterium]|nr:hypothetical protein [Bryobacteraceae bacterium]
MQLTIQCLRFGRLILRHAEDDVFEIVRLVEGNTGVTMARIEVEEKGMPALRITPTEPGERVLDPHTTASVHRAVLASRRDESHNRFQLTAAEFDDGVELVLSGDHRYPAPGHRYRVFSWRAECRLAGDEIVVHGPFLSDDPDF